MSDTTHADVIIIGGGPAALTAAIYTSRAKLNTLVFEGEYTGTLIPGGQLMTTTEVENFSGFPQGGISGPDLVFKMADQAKEFGATLIAQTITSLEPLGDGDRFAVRTRQQTYHARAVILATGADAKYLGVPGERELMNKGVSACATCDGALPRFRNRVLVVVGGGDTAMEEATFLSRFASKVCVVHRRDVFRASKIMAERVLSNPKIEVRWNTVVTAVRGDDNDGVTGVMLRDVQSGAESTLECAGYFCAIGRRPNSDLVRDLAVDVDNDGYIVHSRAGSCYTRTPGLFACGDVCDKVYRQAITAAGNGCMAAIDATRWLEARVGSS